ISRVSETSVQARPQTHEGVVWLLYTLDRERKPAFLEIWNHNQLDHTRRGLRKVYLEYSRDGHNWKTLKDGEHDYFIIPQSKGAKEEPADFHLDLSGISFKYFCITADKDEGNYYHDGSSDALEDAKWKNQNVNYYGLSEIRFYEKTKRPLKTLAKVDGVSFMPTQGYRKTPEGPRREYKIKLNNPLFDGGILTLTFGGKRVTEKLAKSKMGLYEFTGLFPPGMMDEAMQVDVAFTSRQGNVKKTALMQGARKWEVYFLPHSHLDIGYTHRHEDVMNLQLRNIDKALTLAERTKDYPEGARFKWNVETMWPVNEYLDRYKNTPRVAAFKAAVKDGMIALNGSIGNILTGLCKQEEITHLFDDAHRVGKKLGVDIRSVMMSDVPGVSWGMVTAMAENGMKYLSLAPNYVPYLETGGSRVGLANKEWGDYPFYWASQSGDEKVLCWSTGKGYSFFHDWLTGKLSSCGLDPIWEYLNTLEVKEFPYDFSYLRYTVNGDNGPPDDDMSNVIRKWNEEYEYPKFHIGTTEELFTRFEQTYGDNLPVFKGDFTPYWEDGAASTAKELSMNRYNAERLNQLEVLWSITNPQRYPSEAFYHAWRNVALFSEHTWGASASGPDPDSEFTRALWKQKQAFALRADSITNAITEAFHAAINASERGHYIQVFNTNLWPRTDVVTFSTSRDMSGKIVVDESNQPIGLQKVGENKYVFIAKALEPLSSKVYRIVDAKAVASASRPVVDANAFVVKGNTLSNGLISVSIDSVSGAITSLTDSAGFNYAGGKGLNAYIYTGRNATSPQYVLAVRSIERVNDGPVSATLRITSDAPGANSLVRDVTIYTGIKRVDIRNAVDKIDNRERENVRFAFPFNIKNAETVIDLPFGEMRPEREQLTGANKNFFSVNNGVSISGMRHNVLLTTVGTPLLEVGGMQGEAWMSDTRDFLDWSRATTSSPTVYSWVMNNSWRTNYKASQSGKVEFRYSIIPLTPYGHTEKQRALEIAQPLVAVVSENAKPYKPLFSVSGNNKIAVSTIRPSKDQK
ncbi:MAG TPA: glycoside hydrolase family 38 C-terminal domain-containing protein, partial [Chryseosolibacter sp.]|nr:glycoside hydrolase family 38 C-terminal domain-containing protein [Chryseosolibacter sp.]